MRLDVAWRKLFIVEDEEGNFAQNPWVAKQCLRDVCQHPKRRRDDDTRKPSSRDAAVPPVRAGRRAADCSSHPSQSHGDSKKS